MALGAYVVQLVDTAMMRHVHVLMYYKSISIVPCLFCRSLFMCISTYFGAFVVRLLWGGYD